MRKREPPDGFGSARKQALMLPNGAAKSEMNRRKGSLTTDSNRALLAANQSRSLFLARSLRNLKNSGEKCCPFVIVLTIVEVRLVCVIVPGVEKGRESRRSAPAK